MRASFRKWLSSYHNEFNRKVKEGKMVGTHFRIGVGIKCDLARGQKKLNLKIKLFWVDLQHTKEEELEFYPGKPGDKTNRSERVSKRYHCAFIWAHFCEAKA